MNLGLHAQDVISGKIIQGERASVGYVLDPSIGKKVDLNLNYLLSDEATLTQQVMLKPEVTPNSSNLGPVTRETLFKMDWDLSGTLKMSPYYRVSEQLASDFIRTGYSKTAGISTSYKPVERYNLTASASQTDHTLDEIMVESRNEYLTSVSHKFSSIPVNIVFSPFLLQKKSIVSENSTYEPNIESQVNWKLPDMTISVGSLYKTSFTDFFGPEIESKSLNSRLTRPLNESLNVFVTGSFETSATRGDFGSINNSERMTLGYGHLMTLTKDVSATFDIQNISESEILNRIREDQQRVSVSIHGKF
ncbi:MAG: hypothetical protein SGI71_13545 [Verrucomicrobiota bacterium]|nr:hypothetical protein [Verrucomicrobiota bacterium]